MKIVIKTNNLDNEIALGAENNEVYLLINEEIYHKVEGMSLESLISEDWIPQAVLEMEIEVMMKYKKINEELDELAKLLD